VTDGLTLGPGVAAAIRVHGRETYPHECCGAMLGRDGVVTEACALPNTTGEGPRRRFLVRPGRLSGRRGTREPAGLELLGFYHSHPDHPARPSQYDLDHAWPVFSYVILSVAGGAPAEMTSWRLSDDRERFDEETLTGGALTS
jgi:proteasome lid subunit RPN8/RPN11